jgi:hypothetical protein
VRSGALRVLDNLPQQDPSPVIASNNPSSRSSAIACLPTSGVRTSDCCFSFPSCFDMFISFLWAQKRAGLRLLIDKDHRHLALLDVYSSIPPLGTREQSTIPWDYIHPSVRAFFHPSLVGGFLFIVAALTEHPSQDGTQKPPPVRFHCGLFLLLSSERKRDWTEAVAPLSSLSA